MSNANTPFAERTDVLLVDLSTSLDTLAVNGDRVVLIVASEASTTLPCCNQSLGEQQAGHAMHTLLAHPG